MKLIGASLRGSGAVMISSPWSAGRLAEGMDLLATAAGGLPVVDGVSRMPDDIAAGLDCLKAVFAL